VVSTHYAELKELAGQNPAVRNASVSFDLETLSPTYRLTTGIPGVSYAFEIARSYGMPAKVIERSIELLDSRELSVEALIETMQKYEQETREERRRLALSLDETGKEKARLMEKETRLERRLEELKNERGLEFLDELRRHRESVAEKMKELQRADMKAAGALRKELSRTEEEIRASLEKNRTKRFAHKYMPLDPGKVKAGDRVFVLPLEKEAVVESVDPRAGTLDLVLGSSIRTRFPYRDILVRPPGAEAEHPGGKQKKTAPSKPKPPARGSDEGLTIQTGYNTVDLRGMRVDEALLKLEADFDRMARGGINSVVVIHGHGTGAMKEAVRSAFKSSPYVDHFRPGKYGEGGDGVSIVRLKD